MDMRMMQDAHMPALPLSGRTEFERLMQEMPSFWASYVDLYAYFYVIEVAERLGGLDVTARTFREALGMSEDESLDEGVQVAADEAALIRVREYFHATGRDAEWRALGIDDEWAANELVCRLWREGGVV